MKAFFASKIEDGIHPKEKSSFIFGRVKSTTKVILNLDRDEVKPAPI